jgi:hypothetical protein
MRAMPAAFNCSPSLSSVFRAVMARSLLLWFLTASSGIAPSIASEMYWNDGLPSTPRLLYVRAEMQLE